MSLLVDLQNFGTLMEVKGLVVVHLGELEAHGGDTDLMRRLLPVLEEAEREVVASRRQQDPR